MTVQDVSESATSVLEADSTIPIMPIGDTPPQALPPEQASIMHSDSTLAPLMEAHGDHERASETAMAHDATSDLLGLNQLPLGEVLPGEMYEEHSPVQPSTDERAVQFSGVDEYTDSLPRT